ncbi:MAG TPA: hypothetical protein P5525_02015 [Candidatus Paceibacterota bacterium]|nr:hypothetical protein [Candidatus Paceibacterota bacterium]
MKQLVSTPVEAHQNLRSGVIRVDQSNPDFLAKIDPHFRPVWEGRPAAEEMALRRYFLPHRSRQAVLTPSRPRVIKWYCPFAAQSVFPTGHRYCINVYVGCSCRCVYCYATSYEPATPACKQHFARLLAKDLADLERFDVPPAPVHLSNSSDPFQPLELRFGHTKCALEGLLAHRHRFSTVTLLTKYPGVAARADYLQLLKSLGEIAPMHPCADRWAAAGSPAVQVEVSLAFWREEARLFWDVAAASVARRIEGIRALRAAGIPVVLRIDPLFPRSPLPTQPVQTLPDCGLVEAQTLADLESLVSFAREVGVRHVVYSPAKIVLPWRSGLPAAMQDLLRVYRALAAPQKPVWRGGSWRLPRPVVEQLMTGPFLEICQRHGVTAKFCMQNLIETI